MVLMPCCSAVFLQQPKTDKQWPEWESLRYREAPLTLGTLRTAWESESECLDVGLKSCSHVTRGLAMMPRLCTGQLTLAKRSPWRHFFNTSRSQPVSNWYTVQMVILSVKYSFKMPLNVGASETYFRGILAHFGPGQRRVVKAHTCDSDGKTMAVISFNCTQKKW